MDNLDKSFAPPRQHQIPSIYPFIHFILVLHPPGSHNKNAIGFSGSRAARKSKQLSIYPNYPFWAPAAAENGWFHLSGSTSAYIGIVQNHDHLSWLYELSNIIEFQKFK